MDKLDVMFQEEPVNSRDIGFQDCVTIESTKSQGRFTIANKNIEPGELIAVDSPVVKHLDKGIS